MQTKQEQEAKAFAEANESRIAAIRGRLMDAGAAFMRTSIASQLPAMVARKANECLEKHDPAMFGSWLRQAPVGSPGTHERGMYWSLVDACIFFGDAIGTRWAYLTQEGRSQYLAWVEMFLEEISSIVDVATAEVCDAKL